MAVQKTNKDHKPSALQFIRTIYLSLAAVIGLVCTIMGASGVIKLGLNVWFPVDDYAYYTTPYDKSPCEVVVIDGKEQKRSAEEVKICQQKEEENRVKQNQNNFNRQLTESIALLVVGFPVWLLHFLLIQADWKRRREI